MLGVIDVGENDVESVDSLVARANDALQYIPKGQLVLAPDCGMLELTRASARAKLTNLALAARVINEVINEVSNEVSNAVVNESSKNPEPHRSQQPGSG